MKKSLFTILAMFLLILLNEGVSAQGILKGKITDSQNLSLPGASIVLKGTNTGSVSNQNGEFSILNVSEGSYELMVTYLGYSPISQTVEISNGETTLVKFKMSETTLEGKEIIVFGDRLKGQARALNQQKNNSNITNIVSSDQIGRFPDANIGDALKRIPGITMQNDQGEARNIIIRGMAPQLNSVTLNGERLPSAEGDNRNVQMDLIPSDMIQTIEVNKAVDRKSVV
jgi:hypothetical protein